MMWPSVVGRESVFHSAGMFAQDMSQKLAKYPCIYLECVYGFADCGAIQGLQIQMSSSRECAREL